MKSVTAKQTFNLVSIGHRGVGKTVFLAGSYAELHGDSWTKVLPELSTSWQHLWFDCQDSQVQSNIDSIHSYIAQSGQYPPPTLRATNFSFSLKRQRWSRTQTLCHFHWWDIPGEICTIHNREFRALVSSSHGCCVFIDAYALVHNKAYLQVLKESIKQVMEIVSLVHLHDLQYPFGLILTKCDLLNTSCLHEQLQPALQPMTASLKAVNAYYRTFYSLIPIVQTSSAASLRPTGAAAPLLWLVWELSQQCYSSWLHNQRRLVLRLWSNGSQPLQKPSESQLHDRFTATKQKQRLGLSSLTITSSKCWVLVLAILALVGIFGLIYPQLHRSKSINNENPKILMP
jgi:hypothetical protein